MEATLEGQNSSPKAFDEVFKNMLAGMPENYKYYGNKFISLARINGATDIEIKAVLEYYVDKNVGTAAEPDKNKDSQEQKDKVVRFQRTPGARKAYASRKVIDEFNKDLSRAVKTKIAKENVDEIIDRLLEDPHTADVIANLPTIEAIEGFFDSLGDTEKNATTVESETTIDTSNDIDDKKDKKRERIRLLVNQLLANNKTREKLIKRLGIGGGGVLTALTVAGGASNLGATPPDFNTPPLPSIKFFETKTSGEIKTAAPPAPIAHTEKQIASQTTPAQPLLTPQENDYSAPPPEPLPTLNEAQEATKNQDFIHSARATQDENEKNTSNLAQEEEKVAPLSPTKEPTDSDKTAWIQDEKSEKHEKKVTWGDRHRAHKIKDENEDKNMHDIPENAPEPEPVEEPIPQEPETPEKAFEREIDAYTHTIVERFVPDNIKTDAYENIRLIAKALRDAGIYTPEVFAYTIATIESETAGSFRPVREGYFVDDDYSLPPGTTGRREAAKRGYEGGENYYGRGHFQLTHLSNYAAAERELGIEGLAANPDLALEPDNAAKITAWYIKKFGVADLVNNYEFVEARRRINPGEFGNPNPPFKGNPERIANRAFEFLNTINEAASHAQ